MQVRDPVCGMLLDDATAPARSTYKGKTYYFCAESEKTAFDQDPERYVATVHEAVTR